jgi:hypothetical protein
MKEIKLTLGLVTKKEFAVLNVIDKTKVIPMHNLLNVLKERNK